jgi:hypothetical protein
MNQAVSLSLTPQRHAFEPKRVYMKLVVDKVALGQDITPTL